MRDARIDDNGDARCWYCGSKAFTTKRTVKAKMTVVGALSTKKKLKCQRCGRYNDVGTGKTFKGPKGFMHKRRWKREEAAKAESQQQALDRATASLAASMAQSVRSVPPPPRRSTKPAGWYGDPSGRFELRYWDGLAWTADVAADDKQMVDADF